MMISRSSIASVVGWESASPTAWWFRAVREPFADGVDAYSVGRKNWCVGVYSQTNLFCDIAR
jgi:hypothetical protein